MNPRAALGPVKPTSCGPDRAGSVRDRKIQYPAVRQAERQVRSAPVELRQIELIHGGDASFNLQAGRQGSGVGLGELLVDRQVVQDTPKGDVSFEYVAFVSRLLN